MSIDFSQTLNTLDISNLGPHEVHQPLCYETITT